MSALIQLENVGKTYGNGVKTTALAATTLDIQRGELVVILGPSGSGKSTLLNLVGGLDGASTGKIRVDGLELGALSAKELADYRRDKIGFIFQFYNLIPSLTASENVELAASLSHKVDRVREVLGKVGLGDVAHHFPSQMSGGQQQRVAIARALVKDPPVLLCDEPTGALDFETGKAVLGLLESLVREQQKTVVIVTHNSALAAMATHLIRLKDGAVIADETRSAVSSAAELTW
jgi:putative ABC transport system ATP-binding protein